MKFVTSPILSIQQANFGTISKVNSTAYLLQSYDTSDNTNRNVTLQGKYFVNVWDMLNGAEES